jgi:hypothetical protein
MESKKRKIEGVLNDWQCVTVRVTIHWIVRAGIREKIEFIITNYNQVYDKIKNEIKQT